MFIPNCACLQVPVISKHDGLQLQLWKRIQAVPNQIANFRLNFLWMQFSPRGSVHNVTGLGMSSHLALGIWLMVCKFPSSHLHLSISMATLHTAPTLANSVLPPSCDAEAR